MNPDAPPPFGVAILTSRILLALAVLPMLLLTAGLIGSIGMECSPGSASTAAGEIEGAVFAWAIFLAVALPALLLGRARPGLWRVILAVALALVSGLLAVVMLSMAALGHTC
jgi:hypothetical protein